ncbi:hypothetical protein [Gilliamella apicola]|uniref:hypothetical protein n=1 Tax=Gilliamella apicola TaxID=1196095 RepID=UPI002FEE5266
MTLNIITVYLKINVKNMALTRAEINQRSNEKRGIKNKGFKLNVDDITMIKQTAIDFNMSEAKLVVEAIKFFKDNKKAS